MQPVEDFSLFDGFSCLSVEEKDRDLEEFIQTDALRHFRHRMAVTYSLSLIKEPHPLGFATLQNDTIAILDKKFDLPEMLGKYAYKSYPAAKIGRLGISIAFQHKRLGSILLYMIKQLLTTDNRTGCRFLTVDAWRNKKSKVNVCGFYEKNAFKRIPYIKSTSGYIPMYFDLATFQRAD